jgi:hypothetical protein
LREVVGAHHQFLGQLPLTQDAHSLGRALGQPNGPQGGRIHHIPIFEYFVKVTHIDDMEVFVPGGMAEAPFGNSPEQLHLSALEGENGPFGACAGILSLASSSSRFAVAAADTSTHSLFAFQLVYALVDAGKIHVSITFRLTTYIVEIRNSQFENSKCRFGLSDFEFSFIPSKG